MKKEDRSNLDKLSIFEILRQIKAGKLDARILPRKIRLECVYVLMFENINESAIADILKVSLKTIKRDKKLIFKENIMELSESERHILLGEYIFNCRSSRSRLQQLARSNEGSLLAKGQCEFLAWKIEDKMIKTLIKLGLFNKDTMIGKLNLSGEKKRNYSEEEKDFIEKAKLLDPMDRYLLAQDLRKTFKLGEKKKEGK